MKQPVLKPLLTFVFLSLSLFADPYSVKKQQAQQIVITPAELSQYDLPNEHYLHKKLNKIFKTPSMFDNPTMLRKSRFIQSSHYGRGLFVAWHPEIPGYIFKKFNNSISNAEQLENYVTRIRGSRTIRQFIEDNQITQIVVPQKWLYRLPENFSNPETRAPSYLLIAERVDIMDQRHTKEKYSAKIPKKLLQEYVTVLARFRGLDSTLENMPFTKDHKIAFIDLYKWEQEWRPFLRVVKEFMRPSDIKFAKQQFRMLNKKQ